ncbi:MAG: glycosyl hydrolase family 28-related protein [Bryobacteraceae bacterium]
MNATLSISTAALALIFHGAASAASGVSYYPERLDDPKAVYLAKPGFPAHADGLADDSAALQAAIDQVQQTTGEGIVFVPQGRYRITRTIYVWQGIRVIGYGAKRPVILLPDRTPGYQQGIGAMIFFSGFRPGPVRRFRIPAPPPGPVPPNPAIGDANPGTFYSAMSNIDIEIGDGNPSAVAVRFHVAQHGYLSHMDFHLGSGLAGIHDVGNAGEDLHFHGGRYGILTRKPSPAWQYTLIDSTFDGQREAAIRENEAQLTVIRTAFRNVPTAIAIDRHYADWLWVKDARFENISGPAVVVSNENSRFTQINLEDVDCTETPVFVRFRESGRQLAGPARIYRVKSMSHGLTIPGMGGIGSTKTSFDAAPMPAMPPPGPPAIANLPPMSRWMNLRSLGAKGDGKSDDTAIIRKAIADHDVIYLPSGRYVITDTISLRPETVLIGLHPDETQLDLLDSTPGFEGPGAPRPLLLAPKGGRNIVTGIGLYTGGVNSRAAGAIWMAGPESLMADVRFLGGHGTRGPDGKRENPYNSNLSADPNPRRRWDSQYHSLWITHGGGGTFFNLWTPNTFAQSGLYISDTKTPGRVYQVSAEHHVRTEIKLDQVENWELYALQTEGERGESEAASALEISRCRNLTIANFHGYRVTRSIRPFPYAIRISDSTDIRFRNVHVDANSSAGYCLPGGECTQIVRASKYSFGTAILDADTKAEVRDREFAVLDYPGARTAPPAAKAERLATGFYNLGGGVADAQGRLYFTDARRSRIYRWSHETRRLAIVRDSPLDPVNLAMDQAGNLLVISSGGSGMAVYAFHPDGPEDELELLERRPYAERPGMRAILPPSYWVNGDFTNTLDPATLEYASLEQMFFKLMRRPKTFHYVSPDGTTFIPTDEVYVQGPPFLGYKWAHVLQTYGLAEATPGKTFYVTNEAEQKTYSAKVNADGALTALRLFASQGGESIAQDSAGNVYLAAGQIFVYSPAGKLTGAIAVPERPLQLVFGGKDRRTLYALTSSSLYSIQTR